MRIFSAGIATETNTFAPSPTGLAAFAEEGIRRRSDAVPVPVPMLEPGLARMRRAAAEGGHELLLGLFAFAQPGGRVVGAVYESLRDELLDDLRAAMPVDAVVLLLHGAMVADGCDDCEGDILERVRAIVGPQVSVGVALDLHCHMTERMRAHADVIVAFKEYPHVDVIDRLDEVWRLTIATANREIRPVTALFDCRMVGLWHTTAEPMRSFVQRMQQLEREPGVLSVSLGHGFPWGDVADCGARLWVVTDDDAPRAERLAAELGAEFYALRAATRVRIVPLDETIDRMLAAARPGRPTVVADRTDNPGGGAPSDATFLLRRLVERGTGGVALGAFFDPGAVHTCAQAGVGACLTLRVGGKIGAASGDPLDLAVVVRAVHEAHSQAGLAGTRLPYGRSAWVTTDGGLDLVLVSQRQQVYGTDAFTGLGIDLSSLRGVVVKSSQHFHAAFAPLAAEVLYADGPGLLRTDFESIPFRRRDGDYWPRSADPLGLGQPAPRAGS